MKVGMYVCMCMYVCVCMQLVKEGQVGEVGVEMVKSVDAKVKRLVKKR